MNDSADQTAAKLLNTMDAQVWAKEFCRITGKEHPADIDTMRAWFANAIMTGYDHAKNKAVKLLAMAPSNTDPVVIDKQVSELHIELGYGRIEVAQGHYGDDHLPAILFGRNGAGKVGVETESNRVMEPGECIAAITFTNPESLDVLEEKIDELRARIWPESIK
jgi:hypothetical protein